MHKSATKCNKTLGKWCKNKHGASKIMDMLETYQTSPASMAGLEAVVERIQKLRDNHLAAHHVVNSFVRHNIAPQQR
jgi:hypothetical protein